MYAGNLTGLILFLFTIWIIGFLITLVHELGHACVSGGQIEFIQIGIAIWKPVKIGKFKIYPLFPIAGGTKLTIDKPTKERVVLFAVAGIIAGLVASLLVGLSGFCLLTPEAMMEFLQTHKLRFLLEEIIAGTASTKTTIATAFLTSSVLYGVQQVGNFFPVPGYDGHLILNTFIHR